MVLKCSWRVSVLLVASVIHTTTACGESDAEGPGGTSGAGAGGQSGGLAGSGGTAGNAGSPGKGGSAGTAGASGSAGASSGGSGGSGGASSGDAKCLRRRTAAAESRRSVSRRIAPLRLSHRALSRDSAGRGRNRIYLLESLPNRCRLFLGPERCGSSSRVRAVHAAEPLRARLRKQRPPLQLSHRNELLHLSGFPDRLLPLDLSKFVENPCRYEKRIVRSESDAWHTTHHLVESFGRRAAIAARRTGERLGNSDDAENVAATGLVGLALMLGSCWDDPEGSEGSGASAGTAGGFSFGGSSGLVREGAPASTAMAGLVPSRTTARVVREKLTSARRSLSTST